MSDARADSIRVMCPLFHAGEGGSTPTSALQLRLYVIDHGLARQLNRLWHSRLPLLTSPQCRVAYVAEHDGLAYAVAVWCRPIARILPQTEWLELQRLAIAPDAPRNTASRILAVMTRLVRERFPDVTRLISYQDMAVHDGTIYRAAGWTPAVTTAFHDWDHAGRSRSKPQSTAPKTRWEKVIRMNPTTDRRSLLRKLLCDADDAAEQRRKIARAIADAGDCDHLSPLLASLAAAIERERAAALALPDPAANGAPAVPEAGAEARPTPAACTAAAAPAATTSAPTGVPAASTDSPDHVLVELGPDGTFRTPGGAGLWGFSFLHARLHALAAAGRTVSVRPYHDEQALRLLSEMRAPGRAIDGICILPAVVSATAPAPPPPAPEPPAKPKRVRKPKGTPELPPAEPEPPVPSDGMLFADAPTAHDGRL